MPTNYPYGLPVNNYKAVVPLNQVIHNTPYNQRKFSSVGVSVPDEPLDTIIQIVANNEYFKVPSSKAVYDAINNLRELVVQNDSIIDYIDPVSNDKIPSSRVIYEALQGKLDTTLISQTIEDNVYDKIVSSNAVYDFLQNVVVSNVILVTYDFPVPSLEWLVTHNKNTRTFQESVFDSDGNKIYANVRIIDVNSFKIEFTDAISGSVTVKF